MKPNHRCDPARMALLYIRQQFICTTFKFDAYIHFAYCKSNFDEIKSYISIVTELSGSFIRNF